MAGLARIFYAIIYSTVYLGIGSIGSASYSLINNKSPSTICQNPFDWRLNSPWVGGFALCLLMVNQARWRQAPVIVGIALTGYTVNYFSSLRFVGHPEIANCLGGFTVGILGNIYCRGDGLAFAVMAPAIMVQAPGGLAAHGALLAGFEGTDEILNFVSASISKTLVMFNFIILTFEVAFGIVVGLCFLEIILKCLRRNG